MAKRDPRIDAYIARAQPFAKPILDHLRALVHKACPDVEETMKWSFPHFDHMGTMCSMAAFKQHCAFTFWKHNLVMGSDTAAKKSEDAMGQFGRIDSLEALPADRQILAWIKKARALNEQGVKDPKALQKRDKKPLKTPTYVTRALQTNGKARAAFEAFSPSHRREYVEWIVEAKTEATRAKRIATMLQWLSEGKSRNWKYERPRAS